MFSAQAVVLENYPAARVNLTFPKNKNVQTKEASLNDSQASSPQGPRGERGYMPNQKPWPSMAPCLPFHWA